MIFFYGGENQIIIAFSHFVTFSIFGLFMFALDSTYHVKTVFGIWYFFITLISTNIFYEIEIFM